MAGARAASAGGQVARMRAMEHRRHDRGLGAGMRGLGLGCVGWGWDACEGVGTWVDGQVGSMVMGQRGCGATWLWGSGVVVVGKGGDTSPV